MASNPNKRKKHGSKVASKKPRPNNGDEVRNAKRIINSIIQYIYFYKALDTSQSHDFHMALSSSQENAKVHCAQCGDNSGPCNFMMEYLALSYQSVWCKVQIR